MICIGAIIEQTLGHVTHGQNLARVICHDPSIQAMWGLPQYAVSGVGRYIPLYRSNWSLRAGLLTRKLLAEFRHQGEPDVLFFHTQVVSTLAWDWMRRIPSVISLDATPRQIDQLGEYYQHPVEAPSLEKLKWRLARDTFRTARHLVTWSRWAAEGLVNDYEVPREKITVIPPGIVEAQWDHPARAWKTPHVVKILFVGGDFPRKGGEDLLAVFHRLRAEFSPGPADEGPVTVELHLVTRHPVAGSPGITVYTNFSPNDPALTKLYHDCDIFCLPTYADCLALALAEAGASGLPIVSTNVGAISEIVLDGKSGFLTRPGDQEALYAALRQLICDAQLRLAFGERGRAWVNENYSADKNAAKLVDLLKQVANGAGKRRKNT